MKEIIVVLLCSWIASSLSATYCPAGLTTNIVAASGRIEDPIGGGNYRDLKTCRWSITPSIRARYMTITWNRFDLEFNYDLLNISTLNFKMGWTGYILPDNLSIPFGGNPISVVFATDQLVTFKGFSFDFAFTDCPAACVNGYCSNGTCKCYNGWMGNVCEIAYCPTNCRTHGTCNGAVCVCNAGWQGNDCSQPIPTYCSGTAELALPAGNFSDHSPWYIPYKDTSFCRWIIRTGKPGAVSVVTAFHQFEWFSDVVNVYDGDEQDAPLLGVISEAGFSAGPIVSARNTGNISVVFTTQNNARFTGFTALFSRNDYCPNSCSGFGYCIEGKCACMAGKTGVDCSQNFIPKPIRFNQTIVAQLNDFEWHYYSLQLNIPEDITVNTLRIFCSKLDDQPLNAFSAHWKWGGGDVLFFIARDYLPTLVTFTNRIPYWYMTTMNVGNPESGNWIIGVYAKEAATYSIWVEPPYLDNSTYPEDSTSVMTSDTVINSNTQPLSSSVFIQTSQTSSTASSEKKTSLGLIIGIVVVLLSLAMIAAIAGAFFYFKSKKAHNFQKLGTQIQDNQLDLE